MQVTPAAAAGIIFGTQPSNAAPGATISPAVTVMVVDQYKNVVTSDNTDQVTIALGTNPSGATLGGTGTVKVSAGVAKFSNLTLNLAGSGYTLRASNSAMGSATSAAFNVAAASTRKKHGKNNATQAVTDVNQFSSPASATNSATPSTSSADGDNADGLAGWQVDLYFGQL